MAIKIDRVGQLVEGNKRNRRVLVSPEGVPLDIQIAGNGERLAAFCIDILIMFSVIFIIILGLSMLFFVRMNMAVWWTLGMFLLFLVRNLYFTHFELAWQGRTPGKRICGLRVINRNGGELTPMAVITRNLTREVEFFIPLSLIFIIGGEGDIWQLLALFGWVLVIALLPFFNRDHLRAGDLIGGTQVIAIPKRLLLADLTGEQAAVTPTSAPDGQGKYVFTHEQLAKYGAFELQVLEEFLRRPATPQTLVLLQEVCKKICAKIDWQEAVYPGDVRRFLTDFYAAERADLERGQLFGHLREDKNAGQNKGPKT